MINKETKIKENDPRVIDIELARLLAAAVVNQKFCGLLLADPKQALEQGYNGESFLLTDKEKKLILSTHAADLKEFAQSILNSRTKPPTT